MFQTQRLGANALPETYLTDAQLAARYGVNKATPWRWAKTDPTFPKPVKLSPQCTRWKLADLENWEAAKSQRNG
ncbi:helix-turn-helix transcriptional regulator [Allitabrizicola rongguiensis]|uniref:helix-turn-helix transcriptional regulator n=1 Tax=Alitabrizicola rongguiensis TaxID=2909234 RepID=UPI003872C9AE